MTVSEFVLEKVNKTVSELNGTFDLAIRPTASSARTARMFSPARVSLPVISVGIRQIEADL